MAQSPSHRLGQYVGNLLEQLFLPELEAFCKEHGLYLDKHGARPVRKGKKATWTDDYGNNHDLDFVVEKGGSDDVQGRPLAFIEAAWRRYTKHSRNKAQEIQGAVLPLAEKYAWDKPFKGAVLAGKFTQGSLVQLKSLGFEVIYIEYETLVEDFAKCGIDIAFDEDTSTQWFDETLRNIESGGKDLNDRVIECIRTTSRDEFDAFLGLLKAKLMRHVEKLTVTPLFGDESSFESITEALEFVSKYNSDAGGGSFRSFEIAVRYSNGDKLEGVFTGKVEAQRFLNYVSV